ncbi:MAG TPA: 30S ribosome-binding factor RbfA [Rugosibacter sp.]|nr:30S ribosome-binding factor RbfA [Rugosibacter sp.]
MVTQRGFSRSDRVAEQLRRDLADLLRFSIKDPRIAAKLTLLTITDVEVTVDYAHAKVFYTSMAGTETHQEVAEGLQRSAGFLRRELGRRIRIHQIPELHFVYDASVERGTYLSGLIDAAVESDKKLGSD